MDRQRVCRVFFTKLSLSLIPFLRTILRFAMFLSEAILEDKSNMQTKLLRLGLLPLLAHAELVVG